MHEKERKVLGFTKKQAEAKRIADENTITLFGGAIRGGKTYWLILMFWILAKKYPKSRWVIIRASVPTLHSTTLVTYQSLLDFGLQQDVKNWNAQTKTCTLYNGSQIIFMAESFDTDKELNRFRGLEINGGGMDEINECQEETFNKLIERAGSWNNSPGCPIKILATCNPTQNWVKEKFYDRWKTQTLPKGWAYVPARIEDNPHLSKQYLDSLKLLPLYQYKIFVEGEWELQMQTGGEFYKCLNLDKHVQDVKYNPSLPLHISFDENVNPYLPVGIFQIDGKELRMIDEISGYTPNNTVKAVCEEFTKRYQNHDAGLFIYGDATSQKADTKLEQGYNFFTLIKDCLKGYNPTLRVMKSNPSVVMRGNWINTVLEKNIGGIKVIIGENCKKAINDFINLKEAADGTKHKETGIDPVTKVRSQKVGHFTDLFDYLICYAFQDEFLKYQKGGFSFNITVGKNPASKNSY
jgi:hypothetical protein